MRGAFLVLSLAIFGACSADRVTSPTPAATAAASAWAARGGVHDTISRPIADARIEIQNGPQRGLTIFSDAQGRFATEPVFTSPFTAKATKAGYRDQILSFSGSQTPGWFRLDSVNGSINVSGNYTMTFTADAACTSIPGYARRRTFEVTNSPSGGSAYLVSVAGGQYGATAPGGGYFNNVLYAGMFEDTFALWLSDPPLFERFPQGSYLMVSGEADGSVANFPARLTLDGWFTYCAERASVDEPKCAVSEVVCRSSNHQLTVDRR